MSKRGKILKQMKAHMMGILELTKEMVKMPEEDGKWLFRKIEAFGKSYEKELEEVGQEFRQNLANSEVKQTNKTSNNHDDLPF